jgi:hypothetical protein
MKKGLQHQIDNAWGRIEGVEINFNDRLDRIERYPMRVLVFLIGVFTLFDAMTMQVTSPYNPLGVMWLSLVIVGVSGILMLWGICGFEW